jgi:hypothetical protein
MAQSSSRSLSFLPLQAARRVARAKLLGPARRLLWRGAAAVRVWLTPDDNPFLRRALRVEGRHHKPLRTLAGAMLLAGFLIAIGWWLAGLFNAEPGWINRLFNGNDKWDALRPRPLPLKFPPALGGDLISFTAILTLAACAYTALWAGRARAAFLLRQEMLRSTLDQLQLMPIAEERWVWMMSAHPMILSLLIGLAGLPVYLLAVLTGQWSLLDLIGLALVFAAIGHVAPMWQPLAWKGGKMQRQRMDWKTLQENLKMARGDLDPARMTPAQQLESQRRTARAMSGLDVPGAPPATSVSSATPAATAEADATSGAGAASGSEASGAAAKGSARGRRGFPAGLGVWMGIQVLTNLSRFSGGPAGPLASMWRALLGSLPDNAAGLMSAGFFGLLLSWPLLMARVVVAPLPFFCWVLPPVALLLPLWIGFARLRTTGIAASVSASETFWTTRRARTRKAIIAALWLLGAVSFWGYGWRSLIEEGDLSGVLRGTLPGAMLSTDWAIAAAWTVALVLGTILAGQALEAPFTRAAHGELKHDEAWHMAWRGIARVMGWAAGLYFVFCWLGLRSGINAAWLARLLPTVATVAAFLLADFGSAAVQSLLKEGARAAWRVGRGLWQIGLLLEALARVFRGSIMRQPFSFDQAPHVLLSPFVSLFALFRSDLSPAVSAQKVAWWPAALGHVAWWWGPLLQAAFGLACMAAVAGVVFSRAAPAAVEAVIEDSGNSAWHRLLRAVLLPPRLLWRALCAVGAWLKSLMNRLGAWLGRGNEAIIRRGEKRDNAVLTGELRRKVRRTNWCRHWLTLAFFETAVFLALPLPILVWELVSTGTLGAAFLLDWGQIITYVTLIAAWLVAGLSVTDAGQAFDLDRANGTLVFLFLTPLSDAAILSGKVLVQLAYALPLLATALPWLLLGTLSAMAGGSSDPLLLSIFGIGAILSTLVFAACLQTMFATRARKPTEGMGKALLVGGLLEAAGWALFGYWGSEYDLTGLCGALLAITVAHFVLAFGAWHLALRAMRRARYGDVIEAGKTVG